MNLTKRLENNKIPRFMTSLPKNVVTTVTLSSHNAIFGNIHFVKDQPFLCCFGATYKSCDGEFRYKVISYDQFIKKYDEFATQLEHLEEALLHTPITVNVFTDGHESHYKRMIDRSRIAIKMLTVCWMLDTPGINNGNFENHATLPYVHLLQSFPTTVYKKYKTILTNDTMIMIHQAFRCVEITAEYNPSEVIIGQKTYPLTITEAYRVDDIRFSVWREIYFNYKVSGALLNHVSENFPLFYDWFYITNCDKSLYDNDTMHEKYDNSNRSKSIITVLQSADKYAYVDKKKKKGVVNDRFSKLSYSIHKTMLMAESELHLTDLSACSMMEYVGRTMADQPNVIAYIESLGFKDTSFSESSLKRIVFGYMYGLHVLHSKLKIIHSDLHMNNITLIRLSPYKEILYDEHKEYIVTVGGTTTRFYLPTDGIIPCIIDFSRSISGDQSVITREFSAAYTYDFFKDQENRILKALHQHFNKLYTELTAPQIKQCLAGDWFNVIAGMDVCMMLRNIYHLLTDADSLFIKRNIEVGGILWLHEMSLYATSSFEKQLSRFVLNGASTGLLVDEMLLKFTDFMIPLATKITDIFDDGHDMVFEADDIDKLGPAFINVAKFDELQHESIDKQEDQVEKHKKLAQDTSYFESWMYN